MPSRLTSEPPQRARKGPLFLLRRPPRASLQWKKALLPSLGNSYDAPAPAGTLANTGFRRTDMLDKRQKEKIIEKFKTHDKDTGSPQVQIAILTAEIKDLTSHLLSHKKDFSSRKGLMRKVSERRRLLKYLKREDGKAYAELAEQLKIAA